MGPSPAAAAAASPGLGCGVLKGTPLRGKACWEASRPRRLSFSKAEATASWAGPALWPSSRPLPRWLPASFQASTPIPEELPREWCPCPWGVPPWLAADCAARCSRGLTGLRALLEPEHPGLPWGPDPWSIPVSLASSSSHLRPGLSQKCLLPPPGQRGQLASCHVPTQEASWPKALWEGKAARRVPLPRCSGGARPGRPG